MPFPELSAQFFIALSGIVIADLVLAGDNAVVIALAARNLPTDQRRRAILYGAGLAIALRAVLTTSAVFLLRGDLPFVMLVGGLALLYIGWQLAVEEQHDHDGIDSARTLRGAIRTILVADVVMSVDNVLAVAAFAKDDVWLVVFGLVISIPIVMGGASLLLRVIDRFPAIVWFGAALIIYVAVDLILKEPVLQEVIPDALHPSWIHHLIGVVVGMLVTSIAWYVRLHDNDEAPEMEAKPDHSDNRSDSRLMVEGPGSDE